MYMFTNEVVAAALERMATDAPEIVDRTSLPFRMTEYRGYLAVQMPVLLWMRFGLAIAVVAEEMHDVSPAVVYDEMPFYEVAVSADGTTIWFPGLEA